MGRNLEGFARDVGKLVAEKKLFLGAFRRIGLGAWLQFYHVENERITLWDVVLFDIAEGGLDQKEIYNPEVLKYVMELNYTPKVIQGRRLFTFSTQDSDGRLSYKIYFTSFAIHRRTRTSHKLKDSS